VTVDYAAEILRLRATVRDLFALSTIPEAWVGREPPAIAADLADVLIGSLQLDFAFVRLCDPTACQAVEVVRGDAWKAFPEWLQQRLAVSGHISQKEIVTKVSGVEESCRGIVIPIGVNSERGLVAAACDRSDFPDQIDQQLLSVAANHAATAFRNARLINELRTVQDALRDHEHELRQARDELEVKVAERTSELQRSEAYLAEAQRLSHTGSFGWVPASGESIWSDETFAIFGYDPGTRPTIELVLARVHPEDRERVQQHIERVARERGDWQIEHRLLMPDGSIKHLHVVSRPAHSGGYIGAVRDVTAAKRAESSAQEARAELERVARVTNLGELTASIAHELNQPLAAIVTDAGASLCWLDKQPPEVQRAREGLKRTIEEGVRAGEILKRIHRLVAKSPSRKDWVDVNKTIEEVIELTRSEIQRHDISLETRLSTDLPLIRGDRIQLQQVILNLMINAMQSMSGLTPAELTVKSGKDVTNGVVVSVVDSGRGLQEANVDRLFEPFYTTKPDGMGMGLAICRSIISDHKGRLWATPNMPRGAVFQFALPSDDRHNGEP